MKNRIVKVMLIAVTAAVIAGCVHIDVDKTEKTTASTEQTSK